MDDLNEKLKELIAGQISCEQIQVEGDGVHVCALIVSREFSGLSRIKRHRLVHSALGNRMEAEIHALSMRTLTPEEWSEKSG